MLSMLRSPNESPIVVTIAMQRSGTKFFGASLNAGQEYWSFGEVLHPAQVDKSHNLVNFIESKNQRFLGKTLTQVYGLLDDYFSHLYSVAKGRIPHVDIMYNNLGAIAPIWSYPAGLSENTLLSYFKLRKIGVVHIIRDPILDSFVSDAVANARGVFHTTSEDVSKEKIAVSLDINRLKQFTSMNFLSRKYVKDFFSGYEKYVELQYPDFAKNNKVDTELVDFSKVFSSLEQLFGESKLRKTTNKQFVDIQNYKEAETSYLKIISQLEKNNSRLRSIAP